MLAGRVLFVMLAALASACKTSSQARADSRAARARWGGNQLLAQALAMSPALDATGAEEAWTLTR